MGFSDEGLINKKGLLRIYSVRKPYHFCLEWWRLKASVLIPTCPFLPAGGGRRGQAGRVTSKPYPFDRILPSDRKTFIEMK